MREFKEKINKPFFKSLPLTIETMGHLKEYLLQYLFSQLDTADVKLAEKLENKNSELFQTLVDDGIRFLGEIALTHNISNSAGWAGVGEIRTNSENHEKYFDPDTANLSLLIGESVIPELITKVKEYKQNLEK